jgi:hypothetical protein
MRFLRALWLMSAGFFAGFSAAAALAKRALPSRGEAESDEIALVAIFGGKELRSRASAFRGGSLLSWFGGIALDLRDAELAPGARLSVHSLFGGIAIRVPAGWRVEAHLTHFAGGVEVKVPEPEDPDAPRLVLEGIALFGGVAVGARALDAEPLDAVERVEPVEPVH